MACECDAARHRQQLIEMLTLLLVPIDHLEALVAFEERRQLENPNPMLHAVTKALLQVESVLLSHGISRLAPSGSGPFVAREHAVVAASASGKLPADGETVVVAETVRAGYRHNGTGAILRRAKVGLAPAPLAAPAGPPPAGTEVRGLAAAEATELLHDVVGSDTLQGLAVRFGAHIHIFIRIYIYIRSRAAAFCAQAVTICVHAVRAAARCAAGLQPEPEPQA